VIPLLVQRELQGVIEVLSIREKDYVARRWTSSRLSERSGERMNRKRLMTSSG